MKKKYAVACLSLLAVLLVLLLIVPASAQTDVTRIRTGEKGVSLRSSPEVNDSNRIRGIHAYTEVDVYDEVNGWYYVYYKGDWGYVINDPQFVAVVSRNSSGGSGFSFKTAEPAPSVQQGSFEQFNSYPNIAAKLNQKMSTRTGPGTEYDEPGTFPADTPIRAMARSWDSVNNLWWVLVQFRSDGQVYCAYTGLQRIDGLDINQVPVEKQLGHCVTTSPVEAFYAPCDNAARIKRDVPAGVSCDIYGYVYGENSDYIMVEFYDDGLGRWRRAWVMDWAVDEYEMYNGF